MKKKILSIFVVLLLIVFQFVGFMPNIYAETGMAGQYEITTDENGLIGYGYAPSSVLYPNELVHSYYVYSRKSNTSDWIKLTYSIAEELDDYYDGWNYGVFTGDDNQISIFSASAEDTYNDRAGLSGRVNFSFHDNGKILKVSYTITNPNDTEKTFGLWSGGDTMLAYVSNTTSTEGDDVRINEFNKKGVKGMYLINEIGQFNIISTSSDEDIDFWFGNYENVRDHIGQLYSYISGPNEDVGNDSAAFWHWENQTIAPNSSKTYSLYLSVTEPGGESVIDELTQEIIEEENIKIVDPEEPNANNEKIVDSDNEVAEKIDLTEEEEAARENGKKILVYLEVKDITNTISKNDKQKIEKELDKNDQIGMYLDASLYKRIEGEDPVKIPEAKSPIKISFEIPEKLLNKNKKVDRKYTLYLSYNGEIIKKDVKVDGNIGTFETDKFSTYVLTYSDTDIVDNPDTGNKTMLYIIIYVLIMGLGIISIKKVRSHNKKTLN